MFMTGKLASNLMDNLCCVAISATGNVDENCSIDEERFQKCMEYAKAKFVEICEEWEQFMNDEWDISEEGLSD